jgi:hypothetical protein
MSVPGPRSFVSGESACRLRVEGVMRTPGFVALWDFVRREPGGGRRFVAHTPGGSDSAYALDAANYVRDYWGQGREAGYADFPLLGRGPFGEAILIRRESDPAFRPLLLVPRARLHDTPLDIKGRGKSVTLVVWAIRESGEHALAGVWHEGTDLKQESTAGVRRVERGRRQYALFAGLNREGAACGHVSENGGASFGHIYALHKSNTADLSVGVPSDSPPEVLDAAWRAFGMTLDSDRSELTAWLDGSPSECWLDDVKANLPPVHAAWLQGALRLRPGCRPGEEPDARFPEDQVYAPPEDAPVAVRLTSESSAARVEVREYRYSRVRVHLRKEAGGRMTEVFRELVGIRLNPWWYPHGIYSPPDATNGGPFTIGRVIHSCRAVGFTGWIGGVAVFDRALGPSEMLRLATLA